MNDDFLKKEDYFEDECILCLNPKKRLPIDRIIERLDEYLSRNELTLAKNHLHYWLEEARICQDTDSMLTLYNELMGYYRKGISEEKAFEFALKAKELIALGNYEDTITKATTYLNIATVYKTYLKSKEALTYYQEALMIYNRHLKEDDERFGGLYNNMGLAYLDLKQYDEAFDSFTKALKIMEKTPDGYLEQAITYLNLANLIEASLGIEEGWNKIENYLETSKALIESPLVKHNGYYAFVIDKCAPTFDYYGYFAYALELKERAKKIYEGN